MIDPFNITSPSAIGCRKVPLLVSVTEPMLRFESLALFLPCYFSFSQDFHVIGTIIIPWT
jgi:hypothetical protein